MTEARAAADAPAREPMLAGSPLLTTKLRAPVRRDLIHRRRLVEQLSGATEHVLTVLSAAAGWGKTSLVSDWSRSAEGPGTVGWLSLDPQDDDPLRFWTYAVAALRAVVPGLGEHALQTLASAGHALTEAVLPPLINELAAVSRPVVLILDDYHVITNPVVHQSVDYLLRRAPPNLHLLVAGRTDPPLATARLRAAGDLLELRAAQLAFTDSETAQLLDGLELGLGDQDTHRLSVRTEGWPAGLYLAGLSMRHHTDPRAFVEAFTGNDRYVLDYLGAEVLAAHTDDERWFLARTSILARMNAELCDAVTGRADSAALLARIERTNGFVVTLDDHQQWFRYHRLLQEVLRQELTLREPELVSRLHHRAATWFRDAGAVPEAIEHSLAAGDLDQAEDLVLRHWSPYFNVGLLATVDRWLEALPTERLAASTSLCVARVWILLDRGQLDAAEEWVSRAERATADSADARDAALVGAVLRFKSGDVAAGHAAARRVLEVGADGSGFAGSVARCVLGLTFFWQGDLGAAIRVLTEAVRLARSAGVQLAVVYALGYLALAHLHANSLPEARRVADAALDQALEPAVAEHFVTALAHAAHAATLAAAGEPGAAAPSAARAVELAGRGAGRVELGFVLATRARIEIARGQDATASLAAAREIVRACRDAGWLPEWLAGLQRSARVGSSGQQGPTPGDASTGLTDREAEILRLLAGTLSLREIGAALHVSLNTIKTHSRGLYRKLGVSSRAEAVQRARRLGLLT